MPQCSPPPGASYLRACLHALLRTRAVVVLYGTCKGVKVWGPSVRILCLLSTLRFTTIVRVSSSRGSASLTRDTFLSLCFNKNLVSKVGLVNKVCNFQRQIVHVLNTIWLNMPTQCLGSRRIIFLSRSDPCARCARQFSRHCSSA